jgi:hypothetical protein
MARYGFRAWLRAFRVELRSFRHAAAAWSITEVIAHEYLDH